MRRRNWKIAATLTGVILTVILLRSCVATSYLIPSTGMENSLYRGERILVNKWSYGLRLPFISLWGYHRWGDKPVRKDDILVFNNPANLSQTAIDQREVYIGRCLGVSGDTLWVDSLFSVIPSEKNAPDQKFLYTYPRKKEKQLDSLLTILSIRPNVLLGQDTVKNVRSFSRYEYYLLEQALGTNNWIEPADKEDSVDVLKPLIIPVKGKAVRVYPWNMTLLRNTLVLHERKRKTCTALLLYERLLLGGCQQLDKPVRLPLVRTCPQRPCHRKGRRHLVLKGAGYGIFQRVSLGQDMEKNKVIIKQPNDKVPGSNSCRFLFFNF